MRRREFLGILGGATAAWPLLVQAQPAERIRRVGVLTGSAEDDSDVQVRFNLFRQGLQEFGWIEGRNLHIETRWSAADTNRIRTQAAELVALGPDVILAHGSSAIAALKPVTRAIPIVFVIVNDPIAQGFVPSVAKPGGNITGFSLVDYSVMGKSMELLKQLVPDMTRVGFMFNPDTYPYYETYLGSFRSAPQITSLEVTAARTHLVAEIEPAIGELSKTGSGLLVAPDSFNTVHRARIITACARYRVPAIYASRPPVNEGGLMSYGPDQHDIFRRSVSYVNRILKGANPGDLPVQAPTKFDFVINLRTAKALGLTVPPTLLALTDEVIE
jgi:putative ABC transport system substrate-binding protein